MTSRTLQNAFDRLHSALDNLEAAVVRGRMASLPHSDLETELRLMSEDRLKLAEALDSREARVAMLEDAHAQVSDRLNTAMEQIRHLLDTYRPAERG